MSPIFQDYLLLFSDFWLRLFNLVALTLISLLPVVLPPFIRDVIDSIFNGG
jgi:hypothetical protein